MWTCPYCGVDVEVAMVDHIARIGLLQTVDHPFPCPGCGRALLLDVDIEVIGAAGS